MAEDKTLRLIVGIFLVLISLPLFTMGMFMMGGFGMMGGYYFFPGMLFGYLAGIALLLLGIYLVYDSLKK